MNHLKPHQRALALAAAMCLSLLMAESIIDHAFDADPHQQVAQSGRGPAPAAPQRVAEAVPRP